MSDIFEREYSSLKKSTGNLKRKNFIIQNGYGHFFFTLLFLFSVFISNATTYYISNTGNDSNSGTSPGAAWKTLDKINKSTLRPGDQVLFKRGDSWSGTVYIKASGTAGSPIVYSAYGTGPKPIIKGTNEITGWTLRSGNVYSSLKGEIAPNQLFEDEKRLQISRLPATGYYQIDNVSSKITVSISELGGKTNNYWAGATLIMRNADWSFEARKIVSSSGSYITLESAPSYSISSGNNVFVINHVDGLKKAGQWAYNEKTDHLYVWTTTGDDPSMHTIEESENDYGFLGNERRFVTIEHIDIRGFKKDAICLTGLCSDIKIENNTIIDNDECGIQAYGSTSNSKITISNNTISGSNRVGIRVQGTNITLNNNSIEDISLIDNIGLNAFIDHYNTACGILAYPCQNSTISYNRIKNVGYNGIMFFSFNNTIENNRIDRVCLTLQDGAGIYTHRNSSGSVIRNNIISNNGPEYSVSSNGIYLDEMAQGVTVDNNTCFGNNGYGVYLHNSAEVNVLRNTLYNNKTQFYVKADNFSDFTMYNNSASDNIFYSLYTNQMNLDYNDMFDYGLGIRTYNNFYGDPANHLNIVVNFKTIDLKKFQAYPNWGAGAKELPEKLSFFEIKDTLSENLITNGDFASDNTDWYGGEWTSGVLDGGSHKRVAKTTASAIQHYELNYPVTEEKQFLVTMDVATANSTNSGRVLIGTEEIGRVVLSPLRKNYDFVFSTSKSIKSRLTLDVWGKIGDISYLDNVGMYEVEALTIDPLEKSKLFYNDTSVSVVQDLSTGTYKDLYGNFISSLTLQPFTSKILIKINSIASSSNQNPAIQAQTFDVEGDLIRGDFIGQLVASDPDKDQSLKYKIISGNEENFFFVIPETGQIFANSDLSFSENKSVVIGVEVTDDAASPLSSMANVTINIASSLDPDGKVSENQSPVVDDQTFYINGSMPRGEYVGQVVASDSDSNQSLTYRIVSGNEENLFFILPEDGKIYTNSAVQFSANRTINLGIEVRDNASYPLSAFADIAININSSNENSVPVIQNQSFDIQGSKQRGEFVGMIVASDPDENQILNYRIISGNEENLFFILPWDGKLLTNSAFHFSQDKTVVLGVEVTDNASEKPLSARADVTINISSTQLKSSMFLNEHNEPVSYVVAKVDMYPNPTQDYITVRFSVRPEIGTRIEIMNLAGKCIMNHEVNSTHEVIDFQSQPSGVYMVKVIYKDTYQVKKLLKN